MTTKHAVAAQDLNDATESALASIEELVPPLAGAYADVIRAAGRRMSRDFVRLAQPLTADASFTPPDEDEVVGSDRIAEEMAANAADAQTEAAGQIAESFEGAGISFETEAIFTDDMLAAVGERATFAADETLRGAYRSVLQDAAEEGWSVTKTGDALVEAVDGLAEFRADALARTDLNGLANGASVHIASLSKNPEDTLYKKWLATDDELTRESHVEADGQAVLVNERFSVGFSTLSYPGDPFGPAEEVMNCRCTVIYEEGPAGGVEPEPDPLEGVKANEEGLRWQEGNWKRYSADVKTQVVEKLEAELEGLPIQVRVPADLAAQKVIPDGRFKSQFEVARSGGLLDPEFRSDVERDIFSYPKDLPAAERPIYGYIGGVTNENGLVGQYGNAVFVLDDGVRARTTFSQIDSLGTGIVPSPIKKPSHLSVSVDDFLLTEPLVEWNEGVGYWEAQIHGGVSLDDVKRIEIWYSSDVDFPYAEADADSIAEALADQGRLDIRVELRRYDDQALHSRLGSGEEGFRVALDGLDVDRGGDLAPVAPSGSGGSGDLIAESPEAGVVDPGERSSEIALVPAGEQQVGVLSSDGENLHVPDYRDLALLDLQIDREKLALATAWQTTGERSTLPPSTREVAHIMETIGEAKVRVIPDFEEFDRRVARKVAEAKGELAAVTAAGVLVEEPSTEELALETDSSAVSNGRTPVPWHSVLAVEGEETEDGRLLEAGSIRWRDLPLTLMGTLETTYGHMGAKVTGRIDSISRIGSDIDSQGEFTSAFGVEEVAPLVKDKTVRGVSVDLAVLEWEYRDPETGEVLSEDEAFERWWLDMPMLFVVIDGVILAATVCPMPAIANTEISVTASAVGLSKEQRGIVASALKDSGYPAAGFDHVKVISVFTPFDRAAQRPVLFADAGTTLFDTTAPPRAHFEVTEFPGKTPLTVTDDGRVFGHIATWDTCHVGIPGVCTKAPRSPSNYRYFHTGAWPIAEGGTIDVGKLMLGTGHAALSVSRESATRHYDKPDMVGAYVRAYDGEHGIWVSGVVRPELSAAGLRELRANPPSGDWRTAERALELIAVCAVAVPGFPVARAEANIVASAGGMGLSALIASSGFIVPTEEIKEALVAAGCGCEDMETEDEILDDLLDLGE